MAGFDGYYVLENQMSGHRTFYKMLIGHQYQLVDGGWEELGEKGTYKNEPRWWVISGEIGFSKVDFTDLPQGTPA